MEVVIILIGWKMSWSPRKNGICWNHFVRNFFILRPWVNDEVCYSCAPENTGKPCQQTFFFWQVPNRNRLQESVLKIQLIFEKNEGKHVKTIITDHSIVNKTFLYKKWCLTWRPNNGILFLFLVLCDKQKPLGIR